MARIALLIPNLRPGGAERVTLTLADAFLDRGHAVDLLVMERAGELLDQLPAGVRLVDLQAPRTRDVIRPLARYLRRERPTALHVAMWPLTIVGIVAAMLAPAKVRVVVSDHITLSRQYGGSAGTMASIRLTTRLFYPLAAARICVSRGSADDLSRLAGIPRRKIRTIYNPVPTPSAVVAPDRTATEWDGAKVKLLSVGTLKAQKNHALLITAFAQVAEALDARLLILGEGEERPALQALIDRQQLTDRVNLVGFVADPTAYYAATDLFALSSDYEGFALVIVEALYAGLRVVSTDCPDGPSEILEAGRYGRLVPVGDADALAAAIREELQQPRNPERQRARARDFSVAAAADAYLDALLGLPGATTAA